MRALLWGAFALLTSGNAFAAGALLPENNSGNSEISDEEFVKIRCGADGKTGYVEATGAMYGVPEDGPSKVLFNFVGVDISRCIRHPVSGAWVLVSRKVSLYFDPVTKKLLESWTNPWTGESLNVMHRTYDYQEFEIPKRMNMHITGEYGAVSLDFNMRLPNPLATQAKFKDYSPEPFISSSDSYKFFFPKNLLGKVELTKDMLPSVGLTYYRMGPWEPWMKMKGMKGHLVLNYTGSRAKDFEALSENLKTLIENKLQLYKEAPSCVLKRSVAISWSRFGEVFDAYLRGEKFPLPAPIIEEECIESPAG